MSRHSHGPGTVLSSNGGRRASRVAARVALVIGLLVPAIAVGQNYDESKVPDYRLPELLVTSEGKPVRSSEDWLRSRRPELLELFEREMYGKSPVRPSEVHYQVLSSDENALGGKATRKQVAVYLNDKAGPSMDLLMYLPNDVTGPVPVFLGLNFRGNHTIHSDPAIRITESWVRNDTQNGVTEHRANEQGRGIASSRWPVEMILNRGFGLVTIYYGDIDPDFDDGFQNGVHALYESESGGPDQWGSISAWAWGLSRAVDYLENDSQVDAGRVALLGHSRLGKTSLWAGAQDPRFALVISNNSGCGGAALSRREFGETVKRINTSFPHWFCDNFEKYNERVDELPIDQHTLVALIAPRPVYVASAEEDRWADPRGEFLSALHAGPVYELFGKKGIGTSEFPAVNQPVGDTVRYHMRTGKHDVTDYDWQQYLDFAERHLK